MTRFLTTGRYLYTTVYVDQAPKLSYIYTQNTASAEHTQEEKDAWERYTRNRGMTIKSYHGNNVIFKSKKRFEAWHICVQGITFEGVNAHHNNLMAEIRIRELQELTRTMLVHTSRRWGKAATENLWTHLFCMDNNIINDTLSFHNPDKKIPNVLCSGSKVNQNSKHWNIFVCLVYVLDSTLQATQTHNKWSYQSRVGVYLETSPIHSNNVALVLSLKKGLVITQFHVNFDTQLQKVGQEELSLQWKINTGLIAPIVGKTIVINPTPMKKKWKKESPAREK